MISNDDALDQKYVAGSWLMRKVKEGEKEGEAKESAESVFAALETASVHCSALPVSALLHCALSIVLSISDICMASPFWSLEIAWQQKNSLNQFCFTFYEEKNTPEKHMATCYNP